MSVVKCGYCGGSTGGSKPVTGILHYKKSHPTHPEYCYRQFGKTWDSVLDQLLLAQATTNDALRLAIQKRQELEAAYKQEVAIRATLATKLNGIIMILEHKS